MELDGSEMCHPDLMDYVATSKNCKELCMVCKKQENSEIPWCRHILICGHSGHTRCIMKLFNEKKTVFCVTCNKNIQMIKKNRNCFLCGKWGHDFETCREEQKKPIVYMTYDKPEDPTCVVKRRCENVECNKLSITYGCEFTQYEYHNKRELQYCNICNSEMKSKTYDKYPNYKLTDDNRDTYDLNYVKPNKY